MRSTQSELTLDVDPNSPLSLQHQVRQRLIDAMSNGILPPGRRLPSSRLLARQAGVSRNTITLAYDVLLSEGHLTSRPRSGIFVAETLQSERKSMFEGKRSMPVLGDQHRSTANEKQGYRVPPNWQQYPYPFIDGCIDPSLVPVEGWREALRLSCTKQNLLHWANGAGEPDDPNYIAELRAKVLPLWGVYATADEVISTVSAPLALHLILDTLIEPHTPVFCDSGGNQELRTQLQERNRSPQAIPWDATRTSLIGQLPPHSVLFVGSLRASGAALERATMEALLEAATASHSTVVECLSSVELREAGSQSSCARALVRGSSVVSIGALSMVASLGSAPGVIIACPSLISRIRALRQRMGCEFPLGLQRAWTYFIGLGHYTAACARAGVILQERRTALRDALNHHLCGLVSTRTRPGSSAYRVGFNPPLKAETLASAAAELGVLIEPLASDAVQALIRMGVTSIGCERIREGVLRLGRAVRSCSQAGMRHLRDEKAPLLRGAALRRALSGATILCNTVYGAPCRLEFKADGSLFGQAGSANEEQDGGLWWVEGDLFFRQWRNWAYGECASFRTVIDSDEIRWFDDAGLLIDSAIIVMGSGRGHR